MTGPTLAESDLCIVLPKRQQHWGTLLGWQGHSSTGAHRWAGRDTLLTALSCPSNWLRSSLQLSLDAGAGDVPSQPPLLLQIIDITHRVTVSALPGTNRDTHGTSLCFLVTSISKLLPKDASCNEGPAEPGTTLTPALPWHCHFSVSLPSHAKIILQNIAR